MTTDCHLPGWIGATSSPAFLFFDMGMSMQFQVGQKVVATGFLANTSDGRLPSGIGVITAVDHDGLYYVRWRGRGVGADLLVWPTEIRLAGNPLMGDFNPPRGDYA